MSSVLITGAASGIGAATARRFAHEGAAVAINDAKPEGLEAVAGEIRAAGAKALVLPGEHLVGVQRVEIAGEAGEARDVAAFDRAAAGHQDLANLEILEKASA